MIINNRTDLLNNIKLVTSINSKIGGYLVKDMLESVFSASPYIDDIKIDIATIAYNISEDQCFSDGNKRTALCYIIELSSDYKLRLKSKDKDMYNLFMAFINKSITINEFCDKLWY